MHRRAILLAGVFSALVAITLMFFITRGNQPLPAQGAGPYISERSWVQGGVQIDRFRDTQVGATCYVVSGYNKAGISCIPDSQLHR